MYAQLIPPPSLVALTPPPLSRPFKANSGYS